MTNELERITEIGRANRDSMPQCASCKYNLTEYEAIYCCQCPHAYKLEIDHLKAQLAMQAKTIGQMRHASTNMRIKLASTALNATAEDVAKYKAEIEKSVLEKIYTELSMNVECGEFEKSVAPVLMSLSKDKYAKR